MARAVPRDTSARDRWAAQVAALDAPPATVRGRRDPISVGRIVEVAFALAESEGYDAVTMRRIAGALDTGPASLYAHVRGKAELDDLLIGALCTRVRLPVPDPGTWRDQLLDVCRQLRDQFLRYPGISRAVLAAAPRSLDALAVSEGMLAILLAAGVQPRPAAWAIDAALLYVGAYSLEASMRWQSVRDDDGAVPDRAEVAERLQMLPAARFPNTVAHADAMSSGDGHERFDFALGLLFAGLEPAPA